MRSFIICFVLACGAWAQGVVSVEEVRNPLRGHALRAIESAQKHLAGGQKALGMEELQRALDDPGAQPYAISMLGVEHLKAGQIDAAIPELEQAVRLLPGHPENHSNLAYALYLTGQIERGLPEARIALRLDPGRAKTRLVLALLLLAGSGREAEAVMHLKFAAEELPSARLLLAKYLARLQ